MSILFNTLLLKEERHDVFEALFSITALVESDRLGQCIFKVYEKREPIDEHAFSSLLKTVYEQQISQVLQIGDDLTVVLHVHFPHHELEKTVHLREDRQIEGDWLSEPTSDLIPLISSMYEHFQRQVIPGNVFTITFRLQRL